MTVKLRRTMLYIPGNNPGMLQQADIFGADAVLFDLEDSVAATQKDAARDLVTGMIAKRGYEGIEITVRINPMDTPYFEDDVMAVMKCGKAHAIRMPKANGPEDVKALEALMEKYEKDFGLESGKVKIHPMIETAIGVIKSYEIASSSKRIDAITIGGQDLTADMGVVKTKGGKEILWARSHVVMSAKAAGVDVMDTVFADVNDEEGLMEETQLIKDLGFTGKAVINPRQIKPVHRVFAPSKSEVEWALEVVEAWDKAQSEGKGVIAVRGKMIDPPVVKRAQRIAGMAHLMEQEY